MSDITFLFTDIETTGLPLRPSHSQILEVAAVFTNDEFEQLGEAFCVAIAPVEAELAEEAKLRLPPEKAPTWRTRDGRVMLISQMENGHLMNTIRYCERNNFKPAKVGLLRVEARRRGLL